jgi:hypothetical protein
MEGSLFFKGAGKFVIQGSVKQSIAIALVIESAILGFLLLFVIWQLRKLFQTFTQATPFIHENAKRLKLIALSFFAMNFLSRA